jgi:ribonuclease VapC
MTILRNEPERSAFANRIEAEPLCHISAGTYIELSVVIGRLHDPLMLEDLDILLRESATSIAEVSATQAIIGRRAYLEFGKRSGHPAQLNFGDCFAYALAIERNEPLLFKGDDFNHTDVRLAISPGR